MKGYTAILSPWLPILLVSNAILWQMGQCCTMTELDGSPNVTQTSSTKVKVDWSALVKDLEPSCIDELKIVIIQETEREHDVVDPKLTEEIVIVESCEPAHIKIKVKFQQAVDYIESPAAEISTHEKPDFEDVTNAGYVNFISLTQLHITGSLTSLVNDIECRKVESVNLILKDAENDEELRDEQVWTFGDLDLLNHTFDGLDICKEYKVLIRLTGTEGEFDDSLFSRAMYQYLQILFQVLNPKVRP